MIKIKVVSGPVQIGAGEVLRLTEAQYWPRAHNVDVIVQAKSGQYVDVRGNVPIDFKTGEEFGVTSMPKHLGNRVLVLATAADSSDATEPAVGKSRPRAVQP